MGTSSDPEVVTPTMAARNVPRQHYRRFPTYGGGSTSHAVLPTHIARRPIEVGSPTYGRAVVFLPLMPSLVYQMPDKFRYVGFLQRHRRCASLCGP